MKKREHRDRNEQNIFLVRLNNLIEAYENADKLLDEFNEFCDTIPTQQSALDSERSDYLHLLEEYELTDSDRLNIVYKLEDVCERRRNLNNIALLNVVWQKDKNKILNRSNRVFLRQDIKNRLTALDNDYKYRVLTDDDIQHIFDTKHKNVVEPTIKNGKGKRKGCKNLSDDAIREIVYDYRNGKKVADIAKQVGISLSTAYKVIRNNGNI